MKFSSKLITNLKLAGIEWATGSRFNLVLVWLSNFARSDADCKNLTKIMQSIKSLDHFVEIKVHVMRDWKEFLTKRPAHLPGWKLFMKYQCKNR